MTEGSTVVEWPYESVTVSETDVIAGDAPAEEISTDEEGEVKNKSDVNGYIAPMIINSVMEIDFLISTEMPSFQALIKKREPGRKTQQNKPQRPETQQKRHGPDMAVEELDGL